MSRENKLSETQTGQCVGLGQDPIACFSRAKIWWIPPRFEKSRQVRVIFMSANAAPEKSAHPRVTKTLPINGAVEEPKPGSMYRTHK